jgi:hypothetical protein
VGLILGKRIFIRLKFSEIFTPCYRSELRDVFLVSNKGEQNVDRITSTIGLLPLLRHRGFTNAIVR